MSQQALFDDFIRPDKATDTAIAKKSNVITKKAPTPVKGGGLSAKITYIKQFVDEHLGKYKDEYLTITNEEILRNYVYSCKGQIAIDTETTGLNPMLDKIVGICLYSPYSQPAYIPLRHRSYITGEPLKGQLPIETVVDCLKELENFDEDIMFNAKFDTRFMKNDLSINLTCTWDAYIASRLMNENEPSKGLKALHSKYVLDGQEDEFSFGEIFKDVPFDLIPIDIATLYGAHDAVITWELYEFQKQYLYYDSTCDFSDRYGMNGVSWCFFNIEMPCIKVIAEMEDTGILLDVDYAKKLSVEYTAKKEAVLDNFYSIVNGLNYPEGVNIKHPINIGSPQQLAMLFYDVLGYESVDNEHPRGTGEDILQKFIQKYDSQVAKVVLEYRGIDKLLGTYIDKIPRENVNPNDGRVHCNFNQLGADTGRMSSSDPNLQNIPHDSTRKMFIASPGYVLMSSDYSQQEPSCLAALCKEMGYSKLFDARFKGNDLYSEVASACYNRKYEDCVEFRADGTKNPEGKKFRNLAKPVLLGILYGRGDKSVAEGMGITVDEAKQLKANLFKRFPEIMIFEQKSLEMARELGYVTTICGRKRRLPALQLDEYEFRWTDEGPKSADVLDFDEDSCDEVPDEICDKYWRILQRTSPFKKRKVFERANKEDGVWIVDNGKKIADATRQCVNARIQGSAADLTKLAMIDLANSEELKRLGFRLLIPVHDEVIAECPEENVAECSRLLAEVMSGAAEKILGMPFSCDVEITKEWYGESLYGTTKLVNEAKTSHAVDKEVRSFDDTDLQ